MTETPQRQHRLRGAIELGEEQRNNYLLFGARITLPASRAAAASIPRPRPANALTSPPPTSPRAHASSVTSKVTFPTSGTSRCGISCVPSSHKFHFVSLDGCLCIAFEIANVGHVCVIFLFSQKQGLLQLLCRGEHVVEFFAN